MEQKMPSYAYTRTVTPSEIYGTSTLGDLKIGQRFENYVITDFRPPKVYEIFIGILGHPQRPSCVYPTRDWEPRFILESEFEKITIQEAARRLDGPEPSEAPVYMRNLDGEFDQIEFRDGRLINVTTNRPAAFVSLHYFVNQTEFAIRRKVK